MKKKTGEGRDTRRLALRKEILRHLQVAELAVVAGGLDPQCQVTRTGACNNC